MTLTSWPWPHDLDLITLNPWPHDIDPMTLNLKLSTLRKSLGLTVTRTSIHIHYGDKWPLTPDPMTSWPLNPWPLNFRLRTFFWIFFLNFFLRAPGWCRKWERSVGSYYNTPSFPLCPPSDNVSKQAPEPGKSPSGKTPGTETSFYKTSFYNIGAIICW